MNVFFFFKPWSSYQTDSLSQYALSQRPWSSFCVVLTTFRRSASLYNLEQFSLVINKSKAVFIKLCSPLQLPQNLLSPSGIAWLVVQKTKFCCSFASSCNNTLQLLLKTLGVAQLNTNKINNLCIFKTVLNNVVFILLLPFVWVWW